MVSDFEYEYLEREIEKIRGDNICEIFDTITVNYSGFYEQIYIREEEIYLNQILERAFEKISQLENKIHKLESHIEGVEL